MNKAESFYWNKLSTKSFSFELEQFFDLCFFWLFMGGGGGAALVTFSIYHYCLIFIRQKEFSREFEMSKVESFCWNKLSSKSFSSELEQFFDLCIVLAVHGGGGGGAALITSSIYHYCVVRQKKFSKKVEMSKVESFYWNEPSSESLSFELEQFFIGILF